ncbi:MAG: OmpH family outer membrane protein [Rhodospirillaceae bacterium]|nr:OmpH family outer membrane protein [Rhodospirillaceae bacterium]
MSLKYVATAVGAAILSWGMILIPMAEAATSAAKPAPVIRVVDIQEVMEKSTAVQGIRRELDAYRKKYDDEFAAKEKVLKDEERQIVRQQPLVDAAVYRDKVQEFQKKFASFQRELKTRQQLLQNSYATALNQVSLQVQKIWAAVADAEGATVLLPRGQVLLFSPGYDVTKDVIDRLNKALPSVKFSNPMSQESASGSKKK